MIEPLRYGTTSWQSIRVIKYLIQLTTNKVYERSCCNFLSPEVVLDGGIGHARTQGVLGPALAAYFLNAYLKKYKIWKEMLITQWQLMISTSPASILLTQSCRCEKRNFFSSVSMDSLGWSVLISMPCFPKLNCPWLPAIMCKYLMDLPVAHWEMWKPVRPHQRI